MPTAPTSPSAPDLSVDPDSGSSLAPLSSGKNQTPRLDPAAGGIWSQTLRANGPLLAVVLVYFTVGATVVSALGYPLRLVKNSLMLWSGTFFLFSFLLVAYAIFRLVRANPASPIRFLLEEAKRTQLLKRAAYGLPIVAVLPVFFATYGGIKSSINKIVPYYADPWLSDLDRSLHGGLDAWRIVQPVLGTPLVTFLIGYSYQLWFAVVFLALACAAFMVRNDRLRTQFLLAYFLSWILVGNILALALSSVGPCYFEVFGGDDRYRELFAYLNHANEDFQIGALVAQARLLELYRAGGSVLGSGISAMPSMHVALAALIVFFAFNVSRILGAAAFAFAAIIMIGSVHLGWHYAIDGYVSLLLVTPIWMASGWMADRLHGSGRSRGSAEAQTHGE